MSLGCLLDASRVLLDVSMDCAELSCGVLSLERLSDQNRHSGLMDVPGEIAVSLRYCKQHAHRAIVLVC